MMAIAHVLKKGVWAVSSHPPEEMVFTVSSYHSKAIVMSSIQYYSREGCLWPQVIIQILSMLSI